MNFYSFLSRTPSRRDFPNSQKVETNCTCNKTRTREKTGADEMANKTPTEMKIFPNWINPFTSSDLCISISINTQHTWCVGEGGRIICRGIDIRRATWTWRKKYVYAVEILMNRVSLFGQLRSRWMNFSSSMRWKILHAFKLPALAYADGFHSN